MKIDLNDDYKQNSEEKKIVDERCYCGHLKSEHGYVVLQGINGCFQCSCREFVWFGYIFSDGSET